MLIANTYGDLLDATSYEGHIAFVQVNSGIGREYKHRGYYKSDGFNWYPTNRFGGAVDAEIQEMKENGPFPGEIKTIRTQNPNDFGNWLLCDNRLLLQTERPELFAAIGIRMNAGTGANDLTQFALPLDNMNVYDDYHDFIYAGKLVTA